MIIGINNRAFLIVILTLLALTGSLIRSGEAAAPATATPQNLTQSLSGRAAVEFLQESGLDELLPNAGAFVQQGKLLASDGVAQDSMGFSVAISGNTAIVGSPADQVTTNPRQGSAYVFVRTGTTWAQQQKLTASDGAQQDEFGYSVAISGDTVFVGRHNTQQLSGRTRGAVCIFTRSGTTWTQGPTLTSNDGVEGDVFGISLAYNNGTLLVGAQLKNNGSTIFQGAAYVFTGSGSSYTQQAKLLANDGGFADYFGTSVTVSGDTAIVGAPGQVGGGAASGRGWAYVFTRTGSTWAQQQKLIASDGVSGDAFGFSVGLSGETAIIGARLDTIGSIPLQGSAYVFNRAGTVWTEGQKLLGIEPIQRNDNFGYAVAIVGDTIAIGSPAHEFLPLIANHGAVYIFTRAGGTWTRQQKLLHDDASSDAFGQAVALDGASVIGGAPAKNSNVGAAYVFALGPDPTPTPSPSPSPSPTSFAQFSSSTFEATEGVGPSAPVDFGGGEALLREAELAQTTGSAAIMVTRTGDTTGAASVDFATQDGTAKSRSDYTATYGTLQFASGETSKSIVVFITDDRFLETGEAFSIVLSNPVGLGIGTPGSATINVTSDDAQHGANPVRNESFDAEFFVRQHYADFLGREPDSSGLNFWKGQITECETLSAAQRQGCREERRINVSAAFFLSIEFQQTGYFVYLLHQAAFNQHEQQTMATFLADSGEVRKGIIVGQGNWEQQLETNKTALATAFVGRQVFLTGFPLSLTPAQFVDAVNANTGGSLSQSERDARVAELSANNTNAGRAAVLRKIVDDADFAAREFNRAFVLMQYFGYLRRNPNETPDANFDGYNFWLAKLNQFNGNFVDSEMVKAFITSSEYQGRFGP